MIEKCSIGNMSYNLQNITLILLILILIIVIIYYLKNSNAKHNELIEKYTTPTTTNAEIKESTSYYTHNPLTNSSSGSTGSTGSSSSTTSSQLHTFPTSGTVVTLRPCQVQFNNTFENNYTLKYEYADDWKEIATIKAPTDTSSKPIEKKIISLTNETNNNDKDVNNKNVFTNYSEESKCFKRMSGTNNIYRYDDNDLIKYSNNKHAELKLQENGVAEQYMQMEFDLTNSTQHYNNLIDSICSLQYSDTVSGLSGNLIRLSLNADNIITDIKRVTVNSTNNHIFTIDSTFNISSLITSTTSGKYRYNSASSSYEYETTNTASSGLIININLYQFNRNLLCDKTSGTTTYQNIKTYTKLSNAKININSIVDINLPPKSTISNTTLPTRYNTNTNITGDNMDKATLIRNIDTLIESELVNVNSGANSEIARLNTEKSALILARNTFIDSIPSLQTFINNAIIKSNYDNSNSKYNTLLNSDNYNLKLKKVEYTSLNLGEDDTSINLSLSEEPTIKEVLTSAEIDVYETRIFNSNDSFTLYENTLCDILIVGGGGGGGFDGGGGGGGGEVKYYTDNSVSFKTGNAVTLNAGTYTVNIGNGGIGGTSITTNGNDGGLTYISNNNITSSSTPSVIPNHTDKTKYVEYLAQVKTGVGGWRIVRYLPPTSKIWYPVNDNLSGTITSGTPYSYDNFWTVPFGTFDEFVFATFNMNYWLYCTKTTAYASYNNTAANIIKSSFSATPYTALWYNRGAGNPEDPLISIQNYGGQVVYAENATNFNPMDMIPLDGGMCVLVRQSTPVIIYSAVGGGGGGSRNNRGNSSNGGGSGGNGHANGEASVVNINGEAGGAGGTNGGGGHNTGGGGGGGGANITNSLKNGRNSQRDVKAGDGGIGVDINISGINIGYGGGGGGGSYSTVGGNATHGGGKGNVNSSTGASQPGIDNTGGGGGSGGNGGYYPRGEKGGSGVVIIRYKTGIKQSIVSEKISLKYENILETQIYNSNSTLTLNPSATADILIVGGGAGGARNDGAEGGGGGGGGGVIHAKLKISDSSSRVLNIKIGSGGAPNNPGDESSITYNNNSGYQIKLTADGGGTGGGSYAGCGDGKGGIGKPGGSGGGGSGYCHNLDGGASTGIKNKSDIQNNDSSIVSYNYYGNKGGLGHNQAGGAGGGGAGEVGHSTTHVYDRPGRQGGSGINIPLFDDKYYGAGGGGGGQYQYNAPGGNGGRGGGGNGAQRGYDASNGLANTGSGGGGTSVATPGSGGSGIVIIKYNNNNSKIYKLRVPTKTNIEFKTDNTIHYTGNLHGTYKITINSTNIKIEVYPGVSGTTININDLIINSNKMDIIYNLNKSIDDINTTEVNATSSTVIDIYNNTIPYTHTHYNRYKISSHISKTYKITTSGVDSVDFNLYLYSNTDVLIPSANYSIKYHYPSTDSNNVIIPINIFITIRPMPSNPTYTGLKIKTYSRRANSLDETEIYAFIGKTNGQDTSISDFNSILNLTTSLTEKDVWGIVAKQSEINTQNARLINKNNIEARICNISQPNDHICNIKTLISIKNSINNTTFTGTSPEMIQNVSITSTGLFPMSTVNPILNYNITDYISYESATAKAPTNRSTQFNILNNASKYIYFAIPGASS